MRNFLFLLILIAIGIGGYLLFTQRVPQTAELATSQPASDSVAGRVVTIATEGEYPPFNYIDEKGTIRGFDVDIAREVCKAANIDCRFVAQDWDGLILGLLSRKFDVIAASMSITPERQKSVAFTDPYYRTPIRFIAPAGEPLIINQDGLQGKVIGVQRATTSANYLEKNYSGIVKIKMYDKQTEALLDLQAGRVDAILADALMTWDWLQSQEGQGFEYRGQTIYVDEGIAFATRKSDTELRDALNRGLDTILKNGAYEAVNETYFPGFMVY